MKDFSKLLLLLLVLIVSMVFLIISDDNRDKVYFKFDERYIYLQSWIYFVGEHVKDIIMAIIILSDAKKYRFAFWIFAGVMVLDLMDFILKDNQIWWSTAGLPISMNTVGIITFGIAIIVAKVKNEP